MYLQSINIGAKRTLQIGNKPVTTGIIKTPVTGPVSIARDRVGNDVIQNLEVHGGPDQAVYVYGGADYAWWSTRLGRDLAPGTFGENLTIAELESGPVSAGDRLLIGSVVLEVTAPRIPCSKLATRMGDPGFVKEFRAAARPGMYCRVIQTGMVTPGDGVILQPFSGETVSIRELFEAWYKADHTATELNRMLAAPIAVRYRNRLEEELQKLQQT
jgi:MOSC domain-containing protein YiiM